MNYYVNIAQVVVSVVLIGLILLQQRGTEGLGSAFGGDGSGTVYRTRRGAEKIVFIATIIISMLFAVLAIISVYIS